MTYNNQDLTYCNWEFEEFVSPGKWLIKRDCDDKLMPLNRGDSRNWKSYKSSLMPQVQTRYPQPLPGAQCPGCGKQVNGVNPYDNGETWRK